MMMGRGNLYSNDMKAVIDFLEVNGFTKYGMRFEGDLCTVIIDEECYIVKYDQVEMYSRDHNIYWLVGYLTWNDLIKRDYEK